MVAGKRKRAQRFDLGFWRADGGGTSHGTEKTWGGAGRAEGVTVDTSGARCVEIAPRTPALTSRRLRQREWERLCVPVQSLGTGLSPDVLWGHLHTHSPPLRSQTSPRGVGATAKGSGPSPGALEHRQVSGEKARAPSPTFYNLSIITKYYVVRRFD